MNCSEARKRIDWSGAHPELGAHLDQCPECRMYADEVVLRLLREMPAPEPAPGFGDRVRRRLSEEQAASSPGRTRADWGLAAAASLLTALLVLFFVDADESVDPRVATEEAARLELPVGDARTVSVLLRSPRNLTDARIRVQVSPGLELQGYQDARELEWTTDLKAGANRLSLPVRLLEAAGGEVGIHFEHEQIERATRLRIDAAGERKTDDRIRV